MANVVFSQTYELCNKNFLHIAEISIALPICNSESERVFSFLWCAFSKDCQSVKNNTLEDILCLRSDMDYKPSKYDHAIEFFLSEYPNSDVRKRGRYLDGHNYPEKRKSCGQKKPSVNLYLLHETISSSEKEEEDLNIENININKISDEEWSESDDGI